MLEHFFGEFQKIGVKILFFIRDGEGSETRQEICRQYQERYDYSINVLDHIDQHSQMPDIEPDDFCSRFAVNSHGMARNGQHQMYPAESGIPTIADFARQNQNVVAVLCDNCSFVMFNVKTKFWQYVIETSNPTDFNAVEYNMEAILSHLALTAHQFYIMSTVLLMCSDRDIATAMTFDATDDERFAKVAAVIKAKCPLQFNNTNFEELATALFGQNVFNQTFLLKATYLRLFDPKSKSMFDFKHTSLTQRMSPYQLSIWKDQLMCENSDFIDLQFQVENDRTYADIIVSLFKRMLGVLLYSEREMNPQRELVIKMSHSEPFKSNMVAAEFPGCE